MANDLFITNSIKDFVDAGQLQELKRTLGPLALTSIGIGGVIGTGIFVLTGPAAAQHAGPARGYGPGTARCARRSPHAVQPASGRAAGRVEGR